MFCVFLGSAKVGASKQEKVKKFVWRTLFLLTIRNDCDEHWTDGPSLDLGPLIHQHFAHLPETPLCGDRRGKKYSRPESCNKVASDTTRWRKLIPCCANCANPSHSLHSPDAEAPMFTISWMALWFKFQLRCFFQNKIPERRARSKKKSLRKRLRNSHEVEWRNKKPNWNQFLTFLDAFYFVNYDS